MDAGAAVDEAVGQERRVDGRRLRRERGRTAVIDAMFEIIRETGVPPTVDAIAERAGVSTSSVFRYFDSVEDLQQQTIDRYFERFAPLFLVPAAGQGPRSERIARFVDARLQLYEAIGPIGRLARIRAVDLPRFAEPLERMRALLVDQIGVHFAPEVADRSPAAGEDLVVLIDVLTSFEAWDLLHDSHHRTHRQVRRAWIDGLTAICA